MQKPTLKTESVFVLSERLLDFYVVNHFFRGNIR